MRSRPHVSRPRAARAARGPRSRRRARLGRAETACLLAPAARSELLTCGDVARLTHAHDPGDAVAESGRDAS